MRLSTYENFTYRTTIHKTFNSLYIALLIHSYSILYLFSVCSKLALMVCILGSAIFIQDTVHLPGAKTVPFHYLSSAKLLVGCPIATIQILTQDKVSNIFTKLLNNFI